MATSACYESGHSPDLADDLLTTSMSGWKETTFWPRPEKKPFSDVVCKQGLSDLRRDWKTAAFCAVWRKNCCNCIQ